MKDNDKSSLSKKENVLMDLLKYNKTYDTYKIGFANEPKIVELNPIKHQKNVKSLESFVVECHQF